jgi:hypothetical protein
MAYLMKPNKNSLFVTVFEKFFPRLQLLALRAFFGCCCSTTHIVTIRSVLAYLSNRLPERQPVDIKFDNTADEGNANKAECVATNRFSVRQNYWCDRIPSHNRE